jgi:DNA-directed RNA polymerase sigma subunit (sigma70/sigma32)
LDVTEKGSIVFNYPDKEPWELEETCSLDVAEKEDGQTLDEIGGLLNLTRERVRQVERSALDKLKASGKVER